MNAAQPAQRHICVGHYTLGGRRELLPATAAELNRAEDAFLQLLAPFEFAPGRLAIFICDAEEIVQAGPLESACISLGLIATNAINEMFDAGRVEAMSRRFDVAAVFGLGAVTLQGLTNLGHDLAKVFAGAVVWARPDAYAQLAAVPGVEVRRWVEFGPTLGIGCVEGGGVHLDEREWRLEAADGDILISSRLERAMPFTRLDTQVKGALDPAPCSCGSLNRRIVLPG